LVWKKNHMFSKTTSAFLASAKKYFSGIIQDKK
jgi:hypothetical protein